MTLLWSNRPPKRAPHIPSRQPTLSLLTPIVPGLFPHLILAALTTENLLTYGTMNITCPLLPRRTQVRPRARICGIITRSFPTR